jgi:outer membrane protein OmpA-like peptidoglycan-associated protein
MPTSYVLVAHKDYMNEFVNAYLNLREPNAHPTPEEAAKIYTRFLTRIYVGAQAEEQYRGRLVRPDLGHATVELSRNPLRILEEITRSELIKAMQAAAPAARAGYPHYPQQPLPQHVSGGSINIGAAPVLSPTLQAAPAASPIMDALQAPAALVAAGLLDAPGDPEGWDQPGSLGEIVALLRKLLVLLNVYSFGSPDLPENKTQYLLVGRRGGAAPDDAIRAPAAAPTRIMTLVRPTLKKSSADQWMRPREALARRARDLGYVFDRPPLMISPGNQRIFLFEGGKPKEGVTPTPLNIAQRMGNWVAETVDPEGTKKAKAKDKTLRKALEKKPDAKLKDDTPQKFDITFLGQYQSWCVDMAPGASCWCCEEAHAEKADEADPLAWLLRVALGALVAAVAFALIVLPIYCSMTGACTWFGTSTPSYRTLPPPTQSQAPPPSATPVAPPPATPTPAPVDSGYPGYPGAGQVKTPVPEPKVETAPPAKVEAPRPVQAFHVAFFEGKANLSPEAMGKLSDAAAQALQMNKNATVRLMALGPREPESLWQRRIYAVKDELVRLGVPASRIRYEGRGHGPYTVTIRATQPPPSATRKRGGEDLDLVDDPMSPD